MMKNKTTDLKEDIMTTIAKIKEIVLRFMKKMKKDRVSAAAAESAFFVIMGFVPFFMLLLTLVQYTELSPEMVMSILMEMLPASFYDLIVDIVKDLFTQSTALMSGTVIAAVWATSRSVLAITNGLNSVRSVGENRNYFYMRMRSGIYIVFLVIAIFMSIVMLLFGNWIQDRLLQYIPVLGELTGLIISFRAVASLGILSLIFLSLYTSLPNCKMSPIRQIPGAVFTAAAWSILSYGFSIYFSYFAQGNRVSVYGSLTTVAMMMLWLYFCMWLLFLGAEVNCYLEYPDSFIDQLE